MEILYLALIQYDRNMNFNRQILDEKQVWNYFEIGPVVQEMSFKDIYYLQLWRPLCSEPFVQLR